MSFRDDILDYCRETPPAPLAVSTPDLPKWDGKIFVRRVSSSVTGNFFDQVRKDEGIDDRAALVALLSCDEAGNRIFNDDDVLWLSTSSALGPSIERLYVAACYHNGLTQENREGWRKNSASTAGSGSPCSSAVPSTDVLDSTSSDC